MSLAQLCQTIEVLTANVHKSRQFAETLDREFTRIYNFDTHLPAQVAMQILDVMVLKANEADFFQKLADFLSNFITLNSPFKNEAICMLGILDQYAKFSQDEVWQQTYWARIPRLLSAIQMTVALIDYCRQVPELTLDDTISPYAAQLAEIDSVLEAAQDEPLSPRITEGDLFDWQPGPVPPYEAHVFKGLDPQFESTPLKPKARHLSPHLFTTPGWAYDFKPLFTRHQYRDHETLKTLLTSPRRSQLPQSRQFC